MNSGKKAGNPAAKKLSGTYRADRHANVVPLVIVPSTAPDAPEWLSDGAKEVWKADLKRAVAMGLAECDQSMFGLYCETMAAFVAGVKSGAVPNAAYRSELRKQMELLGIAGSKSRLTKVAAPEPTKASPFVVRKK